MYLVKKLPEKIKELDLVTLLEGKKNSFIENSKIAIPSLELAGFFKPGVARR